MFGQTILILQLCWYCNIDNLFVYFLNVFELRVSPKSNYEMHCAGESYGNKTSVRLFRGAEGAGRGDFLIYCTIADRNC